MEGVNQGIGNRLQEIESNIVNEQLSLSPVLLLKNIICILNRCQNQSMN